MLIGDKSRFAFLFGRSINPEQREIDIFVKGFLLSDFDNLVYVPQFRASVKDELEILKSRKIPKWHAALHWGPTTDDFWGRFIMRNSQDIQLHCKHNSGRKVTLSLKLEELIEIYEKCISEIESTT